MAAGKDGVTYGQLGVIGAIFVSAVGATWVMGMIIGDLRKDVAVLQNDMRSVKVALKIPDPPKAEASAVPPNAPLAGVPTEHHTLPNVGAKGWP